MDLEGRICYWRARAALAKRFKLASEAEVADKIVAILMQHRKAQRSMDRRVDSLAEQMPQELYTAD